MAMEQRELLLHLAVVADLLLAGGEMAVPEQRHLLFERALGRDHAVGPPVGEPARLEVGRAQPVEEAVDHRLQPAVALGLDLDAERLAGALGAPGRGGAARREIAQAGVPHAGRVERREVVGHGLVVDEMGDRLRRRHRRKPRDLLRGAAEAGALQEMGGEIVAPVGIGDGGKVVRPGGRPGGASHHAAKALNERRISEIG